MEAFVERFRYKASKARQAQSRLKALAKLQPIAARSTRGRALPLPNPERPLGPLIRVEGASVGYAPDKPVLRNLDLRLDPDDRIALLGPTATASRLSPNCCAASFRPSSGASPRVEKARARLFRPAPARRTAPERSPYDYIAELMPDATESQQRARLAAVGFGADKADTRRARCRAARRRGCSSRWPPSTRRIFLILDEPTNHLDVDSREALIHAINDYEGAVILISHDRHLIEATVDRLWLVRDGTVKPYDGDLDSYRSESLGERGKRTGEAAKANGGQAPDVKPTREEERRQAAQRRAELAPLRKRLAQHERCVETLQKKIAAIDFSLGDHSLYEKQPDKARSLTLERAAMVKELKIAERSLV